MNNFSTRCLAAEFLGSATLTGVVVGSGIAGESLAPDLPALALLCNSLATAGALYVLITILGPLSGAHFNPVVTWATWSPLRTQRRQFIVVAVTQTLGCTLGAIGANLTFSHSVVTLSTHDRTSLAHLVAEGIATAGLLFVITALGRIHREAVIPIAVAIYIGVAYFACSSTSFANPAITIGRMFTDSFAGIAPTSVMPFIGAQLIGGVIGVQCARYLFIPESESQ
ncbi:MAG: aquaporin [Acidobacteria bacterium]|nr:aquaporin [Acidobacteriota bacterium]